MFNRLKKCLKIPLFYPDITKTADITDEALYNAVINSDITTDTNNERNSTVGARAQGDADTTAKVGYFYFSNYNYIGDEFMIIAAPGTYGASAGRSGCPWPGSRNS